MNTVEYNLIRFTTISYNFNSFPSSLHPIKNILAFPRFIPSKHSCFFLLASNHQKHSYLSSLHSTRTSFFPHFIPSKTYLFVFLHLMSLFVIPRFIPSEHHFILTSFHQKHLFILFFSSSSLHSIKIILVC